MSNDNHITAQLRKLSAKIEKKNPNLGFRIGKLIRTISAAKQTDIKLDSWLDFATWWNTNRSQGLLFTLVDALGKDNPIIEQMKEIMVQQDELERKLHEVYLALKGEETAPAAPAAAPVEETVEAPAPAAPADDEAVDDMLEEVADET